MKPVVLNGFLLAMGLVIAARAGAATLDVSPTGSGTACSAGSPCALSTANSQALAGDVIRLAPGTYSSTVAPARDGAANARITYLGSLANPDLSVIPSFTLTRRYISVKGLRIAGNCSLDRSSATQYAQFDSVAWCNVDNDLNMDQAKDCMAYRLRVTGGNGHFTLAVPSVPVASYTIPERDTVRGCTMVLGRTEVSGNHIVMIKGAQRCVIDSNRVDITLSANIVAETDPFIAFYMKWCVFADNKWSVRSEHNANHLFRWRDSTMFNRVYRDTILLTGYNVRFAPSSAGSWPGTTDQNYFEGLFLKSSVTGGDVALFYQNGSRRDTLRNCVVIDSLDKAFQCLSIENGATLVDHCTFLGNSRYGVVEFPVGIGTFGDAFPPGGSLRFTNNLIYGLRPGSAGSECAISWQLSSLSNALTSDRNLYYLPGYASDRAIRFGVNSGSATYSAPGIGHPWYAAVGEDASSPYASPLFADSTFTRFDPRLRAGSPAIGAGFGGSDIGAIAYAPAGPDVTPPADVTTFTISQVLDNSALLSWIAPGDDGMSGQATAYELRWSNQPINASNFASAPLFTPTPYPSARGGSTENYVLLGLIPNTTYYFALRARDEAGNWSGMSNVVTATTRANDGTPPGAVRDLSASP